MTRKIKVLIVDDSAAVRRALTSALSKHADIDVVGVAPDPYVARELILELEPHVLTLDIDMPRMDGMTFLRILMRYRPIPTIVVSSLTPSGCEMALACLEHGAMDVLCKPHAGYSISDLSSELVALIRGADRFRAAPRFSALPARAPGEVDSTAACASDKVVTIGSSTGGTEALRRVLRSLPRQTPAILMTQHLPAGFTGAFARRLNELCELEVREARDGDALTPGLALLAPGEQHLKLDRDGARYIARVVNGPRVKRHRPSVEVLFESTAKHAGGNAMGVILTGMGDDGSDGILSMRKAGAYTVAQDEASCVVFGMPRVAIEKGGACKVLPLDSIPSAIMDFAAGNMRMNAA